MRRPAALLVAATLAGLKVGQNSVGTLKPEKQGWGMALPSPLIWYSP